MVTPHFRMRSISSTLHVVLIGAVLLTSQATEALERPALLLTEIFRVDDSKILSRQMDKVARIGGEGLVLHRADAAYITGRSDILLKLKPWLDAEAAAIGHLSGEGKYARFLGAWSVRTPDGREFVLGFGCADNYHRNLPLLDSVVIYRYQDVTKKGMPRFASFWRTRAD